MTTLKEEDSFRITEKAKEAGKITSNGLCNLVLEEFKAFKKAKEDITRSTIEENHINGKPAFSNMTVKDVEAFNDPFQICKCYMPSTKAIRKIDHIEKVDFYTLITVIHNFVPLKEKLDVYFKARKEAKCIHGFEKQKTLSTEKKLFDYVNLLIRLLRVVEAVDQEDKSISRAIKLLEEMRISLETTAYKRSAFPTTDKRELIDESTLSESSTEANPCVDEPIPSDDSILLGESSTGANPGVEAELLDCVTLRPTAYQNLNLDKRELIDESTLNESSTDAISCVDEPQLNDDKRYSESTTGANPNLGDENVWPLCIDTRNEKMARKLISTNILPQHDELEACLKSGFSSQIMKEIYQAIEDKLTASSDSIVYTQASYMLKATNQIVFVVYTDGRHPHFDNFSYKVDLRRMNECSNEANTVIQREVSDSQSFCQLDMEKIATCLRKHSPRLMEEHSNLTMTSASRYKCKHYDEYGKETIMESEPCIVFYVTAKGLIPAGEKRLPEWLPIGNDRLNTDVREGRFSFAVGGEPTAKHQDIKIGCQIASRQKKGTLGGFVDHPSYGVCAMTCAHVMLSTEEMFQYKKGGKVDVNRSCYQPDEPDQSGNLLGILLRDGDENITGLDIAFIKVSEERQPICGDFPDYAITEWKGTCGYCKDELFKSKLAYNTGAVLSKDVIPSNRKVIKYGQKTKLTEGQLHVYGGSAAPEMYLNLNGKRKRRRFKFYNQLHIHNTSHKFCERGDSGSLVFSRDSDNQLYAIGILIGKGDETNISFATPMSSILREIGLQEPFSLLQFDPSQRLENKINRSYTEVKTVLQEHSIRISGVQDSVEQLKGEIKKDLRDTFEEHSKRIETMFAHHVNEKKTESNQAT